MTDRILGLSWGKTEITFGDLKVRFEPGTSKGLIEVNLISMKEENPVNLYKAEVDEEMFREITSLMLKRQLKQIRK